MGQGCTHLQNPVYTKGGYGLKFSKSRSNKMYGIYNLDVFSLYYY